MSTDTVLNTSALIDGVWQAAISGATFTVLNPKTHAVLAEVCDCGAAEATLAVEAAHNAFNAWSQRPAVERADILMRWHDLLTQQGDEIADLITAELGKTRRDSRSEVAYGNAYVRWFAEEARRLNGSVIPAPVRGRELIVIREPVGIVAIVTPWNFPYAMLARKIAPALAAGCTVVIRPAEDTPLTALAIAKLAVDAGLPPGVMNVVPSSRAHVQELTDVWMQSALVRKVSFTGSTAVGKAIAQRSASTLKRLSFELGGNAPFIVFEDADIDAAVKGAIAAKFRNSGQTCVSPNRFFVHASCMDRFSAALTKSVSTLKVGDPVQLETDIGPLVNVAALAKVKRHVEDAVNKGARLMTGGNVLSDVGPTFFQPTVIQGLTQDMDIFHEETFGPVIALMAFDSEEEVVQLANDTPAGLAGYFYARDIGRVWRVARALRVGMVGANESMISTEVAPFGGVKDSGYGREGSSVGIDDYMDTKYLCMGGLGL
jgi:succinate-semialdehyde dehydrogenase/glutarate-semialdehyde dehydrogenase